MGLAVAASRTAVLGAGFVALLAASLVVPAFATDEPLSTSKPGVSSGAAPVTPAPPATSDAPATTSKPAAATPAPTSRPTAQQAPAARKVAKKRPVVRTRAPAVQIATLDRRSDCNFFFCWRNLPMILGVGF